MARSSYLKNGSLYLRKHRKWPHSPYKARWHKIFSQQQAMQRLKQEAAYANTSIQSNQQQQKQVTEKPNLLSSLIHSFHIYNCQPTPQAYHFLVKTLIKTSQFDQISSVLDHLEKVETAETPEHILADIIKLYGDADRLQDAVDLFYRIPTFRCVPSAHSLNALLSVLCKSGDGLKRVPEILLKSQVMNIRFEDSSFRVLITALCRIRRVGYAVEMFNCMLYNGFCVDDEICSLLLKSLCEEREKSCVDVMDFVQNLRKLGFCPGILDYTNLIRFLVGGGLGMDALDVLNQMKSDGIKPDIVCYNMVLDGVVKAGNYSKADELFDELLVFGLVPDVYTYNAYIDCLCKQGNVETGIKMVACMEGLGCKPNSITYSTLLEVLCNSGEIGRAGELVREMRSKGISVNEQTYKIMIEGLISSHKIIDAAALLEEALNKGLCGCSFTFSKTICELCRSGLIIKALELLDKMIGKNVSPNAEVWEALLLSSAPKLNLKETTLTSLVDKT